MRQKTAFASRPRVRLILAFAAAHFIAYFFFAFRIEDISGVGDKRIFTTGEFASILQPYRLLALPFIVVSVERSRRVAHPDDDRIEAFVAPISPRQMIACIAHPDDGIEAIISERCLISTPTNAPALLIVLNSLIWGLCAERWFNVLASLRRRRKISLFRRGVN